AYATSCGIRTTIFCPADTPEVNVSEIELQGATVYRVNGLIDDCGKIVGEGKAKAGWFDTSTLKEPYRIEGKKTMGLELAEQLGWDVPDVILYPTGGGTGLIGMWKAFAELEAIGFIGRKPPPPMRPTSRRSPTAASAATSAPCCSTAPPASNIRCRRSIARWIGTSRSTSQRCDLWAAPARGSPPLPRAARAGRGYFPASC